ncbi:MAG: S8 family peptidase [Bacteroidota bacterium]
MKKALFISFLLLMGIQLWGQDKCWIFFTDKGDTQHYSPADLLSDRALARRATQGITIDFYDFPVYTPYVRALNDKDVTIKQTSRWLNAASAFLTQAQVDQISSLSFVKEVRRMQSYSLTLGEAMNCPDSPLLDQPARQLEMVGLLDFHAQGFTGENVLVAVFDNGYLGVDEIDGMAHLFQENRIMATQDYVDGDATLYHACAHCKHGTYVFSILAAQDTASGLIGSAPGADYILLRTENDDSETHQEEDNWLAAAEFADSMGAQVFNTSLGYYNFDEGEENYEFSDLDGETSIITLAGDIAASRGIVVVNSAGNSGQRGLNMPADGDSVLAIGAVDQCEVVTSFSSVGPTADGRIKPDLSAMGRSNFFLRNTGEMARGSGTSFSSPIVAGLSACLLQAAPYASNTQIYQAMRRTASFSDNPNNSIGYGIPNAGLALTFLQETAKENRLLVYPNPVADGIFKIAVPSALIAESPNVQIIDLLGRNVTPQFVTTTGGQIEVQLPSTLDPGHYIVRMWGEGKQIYFQKLTLTR